MNKPKASQALVNEARYEWLKAYKTDVAETRFRKELGPLGDEPPHKVMIALKAYIAETKPQFFSWTKFRDAWKAWLPEEKGEDPRDIFKKILENHTGYAPAVGVYWTIDDIWQKFGAKAAVAITKIGGPARLENIATDQIKWISKEFEKAYGQ